MNKNNSVWLIIAVLLLGGLWISLTFEPVNAGALPQAAYQTPTPNQEGQIIYTVQEGDNCTIIFLKTGVSIEQIIALNDLDAECSITPQQALILGRVEPATATPEGLDVPSTPSEPTATPFEGFGEVCVVLFEDLNGNQMRSEGEFFLAGGVISVNNRSGTFSETDETTAGDPDLVDPVCFQDVPEGEYNLSMAIPDGYNPTTSMNYALMVTAGDTVFVDFGAQPSSQLIENGTSDAGGGRSPLLLAIGLFFLAGGAGLAFFFIRSRQG